MSSARSRTGTVQDHTYANEPGIARLRSVAIGQFVRSGALR